MDQISETVPESDHELCHLIETKLLARYRAGKITGSDLVLNGYQLWLKTEYDDAFRVWGDINEDLSMLETDDGPIFYEIDANEIETSIRLILKSEGKIT